MEHVEEFKDVLNKTLFDVGFDVGQFIQLLAEDMALNKCVIDGGIPIDLREKCKGSPLTKRLREAELW